MRLCQPLPTIELEVPHEGRICRALVVAADGKPQNRPIFPFEVIGIYDPESEPPYSGPGGFRQNGTFLHFLHWVIAIDGPTLSSAKESALALGNGLLQVLDGRAEYDGNGEPEPEDVLGTFEVKEGKIVEQSYRSTFTHIPLTEYGLFELEPQLCERILERLAAQVAIEVQRGGA